MERTNAIEIAAQCWCDPRVSDRVMDVEMCKVFAEALESYANERLEEVLNILEMRISNNRGEQLLLDDLHQAILELKSPTPKEPV